MPAQGLILSRDEKVASVFRSVFDTAGITLRWSSLPGEAMSLLAKNKYDAVIVNCDDVRDGYDVLSALRNGRSNKLSIAFAITSGKTSVKTAYDSGATFVVEKPITADRVSKALRAAYGLILRERRRYLRHHLDLPVFAMFNAENYENEVRLLNVSEGGMSISTGLPKQFAAIHFRFVLPQSTQPIAGTGSMAWKKEPGQFGIKFAQLTAPSRQELNHWLAQQAE